MPRRRSFRSARPPRLSDRVPREVHVTLDARAITWEIAPGRTVSAWGYQGTVPGPTIVAHVGDTLVAHLVNNLPEPTWVHWHGLRPAPTEGPESVQRLVQPGERLDYRFQLSEAGTFWYHAAGSDSLQVERGLYGGIVLLGADEPGFDADRLLILGDLKLDRSGSVATPERSDRGSGPEGEALLINGRQAPEYEIAARQVERWRIVNACGGRHVRLSLGGRPFRIVGGDGALRDGLVTVTETRLSPGDRVELVVGPLEDEGAAIPIVSLPDPDTTIAHPRLDTWGTLHVGAAR